MKFEGEEEIPGKRKWWWRKIGGSRKSLSECNE